MTDKPDWTIAVALPAIGKPTMTIRDRWKQRKSVVAYHAFCDILRLRIRQAVIPVPHADEVERLEVRATYRPPKYYSKKRRQGLLGKRKRTKPDGDNILKAICDALWADDHRLGGAACDRYWAEENWTIIRIWTGAKNDVTTDNRIQL